MTRPITHRYATAAWLALAALNLLTGCDHGSAARAALAPADTSFGAQLEALSEPGGYFDTDNLISNERSYLHVADVLRARTGGMYLGVGPDQNYSYIALQQPDLAVIVDIRRDNMLQHLLFKALFERAQNRLDYLLLLTGRRLQQEVAAPEALDVDALIAAVDRAEPDPQRFQEAATDVRARVERHEMALSDVDYQTLERIHRSFYSAGLDLRFQSHGRPPQWYYPTLRELLLETDRDGRRASYVASEAAWQSVRALHRADRILPVTGDFAGGHALRAVARLTAQRGLRLRVAYTSNVEYYLFDDGGMARFAANLAAFPAHDDAVIVRSVFRPVGAAARQRVEGYASVQMAQPLHVFRSRHEAGGYRGYRQLIDDAPLPVR